MSGDETIVLLASCVTALIVWTRWLIGCCRAERARAPRIVRVMAAVVPITSGILLLVVLKLWSSADVRSSGLYTFFYMAFGAAWLGLTKSLLPMMGISLRDDVLERRNVAALWPVAGALLGLTFCFAGANIGDGPGWWVVLFAAIISTGAWVLFWLIYESIARVADHITIDRDLAAGWRLAGYLTATGIIFGRAVAGDWKSASATIADAFALGWPALVLLVVAIVIDRTFRPNVERPAAPPVLCGLVPALMYLFAAAAWIYYMGPG